MRRSRVASDLMLQGVLSFGGVCTILLRPQTGVCRWVVCAQRVATQFHNSTVSRASDPNHELIVLYRPPVVRDKAGYEQRVRALHAKDAGTGSGDAVVSTVALHYSGDCLQRLRDVQLLHKDSLSLWCGLLRRVA
mmetsp:Transcript_82135/g.266035  ORF Transcript_82135/g.266035 Transcript_82135/m.266035 type:complete len:135 (+) Transcript_82135:86-490(+)